MRGMPSVTTDSTWVSPRWNRPVPWAVGMIATSAERARMSVVPRPSMRIALVHDPGADHLLLEGPERLADLSHPVGERRVGAGRELGLDRRTRSRRGARCGRSCRRSPSPRRSRRAPCRRRRRRRRRRSRGAARRANSSMGPCRSWTPATSWSCRSIDARIHCFDHSRPSAMRSSVTFGAPCVVELPGRARCRRPRPS